jgi:hypothetical protein
MKLDDMFGQEIDELVRLAGITKHTSSDNLTDTASEKANYQKTNDIKPGTEEWFRLWFARPYLTGEKPY